MGRRSLGSKFRTRSKWNNPLDQAPGGREQNLGREVRSGYKMSSVTASRSSFIIQEKASQSCCKPGYPAARVARLLAPCTAQSSLPKLAKPADAPPPNTPPGLGWTGAGASTSTSHMAPALGPSPKFQPVSPAWQRGLEALSDTNAYALLYTSANEMHFG